MCEISSQSKELNSIHKRSKWKKKRERGGERQVGKDVDIEGGAGSGRGKDKMNRRKRKWEEKMKKNDYTQNLEIIS